MGSGPSWPTTSAPPDTAPSPSPSVGPARSPLGGPVPRGAPEAAATGLLSPPLVARRRRPLPGGLHRRPAGRALGRIQFGQNDAGQHHPAPEPAAGRQPLPKQQPGEPGRK